MDYEELIIDSVTNQKDVSVFLTNGVKLWGIITTYTPKEGLTLVLDGRSQSVFYHALATVSPR